MFKKKSVLFFHQQLIDNKNKEPLLSNLVQEAPNALNEFSHHGLIEIHFN